MKKKIYPPGLVKIAFLFLFALAPGGTWSQGIPLPGITLYGVVTNQAGTLRLTRGYLNFTYTPTGGGNPVTIETELADLNGQFSYVVNIPVQIPVHGLSTSPNALPLPGTAVTYSRSANVGGTPLAFPTGQENTTLSPDQHRGVVQRLDLQATGFVPIPEDVDRDGSVKGRTDLFLWFLSWMDTVPIEHNFDRKGEIDGIDLLRLLEAIRAEK